VLVFQGESAANDLCFTADGAHLLAARNAGLVDAWELATGTRTQLLGPRVCDEGVRYDSTRVSLCHSGWAVRSRPAALIELAHIDGRVARLDLLGQYLVLASPEIACLVVTAQRDGANGFDGYTFDGVRQWAVPRSDTRETAFAFLGPDRFLTYGESHLHVRSALTGEEESQVRYNSNYIRASAVSPDATRFASMGWDRLYLYDATTWAKPIVVTGFSVPILSMAYHPTRPVLATVQGRQTLVKYLDANTGKPIKKFAWKLGSMCAVAFSADGALAAASAADGRIVVWDADA
jgi:hypothetical protein